MGARREAREALAAAGLRPRKRWGQHFRCDARPLPPPRPPCPLPARRAHAAARGGGAARRPRGERRIRRHLGPGAGLRGGTRRLRRVAPELPAEAGRRLGGRRHPLERPPARGGGGRGALPRRRARRLRAAAEDAAQRARRAGRAPGPGGGGGVRARRHRPHRARRDARPGGLRAPRARLRLGVCRGNHGERGERAGERERQAQRRAAGGRSEQPSGSAAAAALPRIVRRSRHDYPDSLLLVVPELPEVETVVRCLAPELTGRRVVGVSVRETRLRGGVAPDFAERLTGRRIEGLARRGKYLLAALDDGCLWLVHLGMTGRLTLAGAGRPDERHDHVVVRLDDGRVLTFNDARRFGRVAVIDRGALAAETGEGIDPLAPGFTAGLLFALTRRRRTSIKALLAPDPGARHRRPLELLLSALPGVNARRCAHGVQGSQQLPVSAQAVWPGLSVHASLGLTLHLVMPFSSVW